MVVSLSLGEWLGAGGIMASVVGWGLTFYQVIRARRSATGAERAVIRISRSLLLLLLPELRVGMVELERTIEENDHAAARGALGRWQDSASRALGVLGAQEDRDDRQLQLLREALIHATAAIEALYDGEKSVVDSTEVVRGTMRAVITYTQELTSRAMLESEEGEAT